MGGWNWSIKLLYVDLSFRRKLYLLLIFCKLQIKKYSNLLLWKEFLNRKIKQVPQIKLYQQCLLWDYLLELYRRVRKNWYSKENFHEQKMSFFWKKFLWRHTFFYENLTRIYRCSILGSNVQFYYYTIFSFCLLTDFPYFAFFNRKQNMFLV